MYYTIYEKIVFFSFDDMTALMLIQYLHLPSVNNQNSDAREILIPLGKGVFIHLKM